jgi:hypothetical protein
VANTLSRALLGPAFFLLRIASSADDLSFRYAVAEAFVLLKTKLSSSVRGLTLRRSAIIIGT